MKYLLLATLATVLVCGGCGESDSSTELDALKKKLATLEEENKNLSSQSEGAEPESKYNAELIDALNKAAENIQKPSVPTEEDEQVDEQENIDPELEKQAISRLRTFGKARKVKLDDLKITVRKVELAKRWKTDRVPYRFSYLDADKNAKFIVVDHDITSKKSNIKLPLLRAYSISPEGSISIIGDLSTSFYRWQDYGSYLGNYADYKNDFAKHDTVRFTSALAAKNDRLKMGAILVGALRKPCLVRKEERFRNPPIYYEKRGCGATNMKSLLELLQTVAPIAVLHGNRLPK